jgi:hypothetical protein
LLQEGITNEVTLVLANDLQEEINYSITVIRVEDLSGNAISEIITSFTFESPPIPGPGDLVINEIMADPTPVVSLPDAEFVELFNTSAQTFNLSGIKFADPSVVLNLPNRELAPGAFVILTDDDNAADLQPFGTVISFAAFPSLSNDGDELSLFNQNDELIDEVRYTSGYYNDPERDEGGYTLERIVKN